MIEGERERCGMPRGIEEEKEGEKEEREGGGEERLMQKDIDTNVFSPLL